MREFPSPSDRRSFVRSFAFRIRLRGNGEQSARTDSSKSFDQLRSLQRLSSDSIGNEQFHRSCRTYRHLRFRIVCREISSRQCSEIFSIVRFDDLLLLDVQIRIFSSNNLVHAIDFVFLFSQQWTMNIFVFVSLSFVDFISIEFEPCLWLKISFTHPSKRNVANTRRNDSFKVPTRTSWTWNARAVTKSPQVTREEKTATPRRCSF